MERSPASGDPAHMTVAASTIDSGTLQQHTLHSEPDWRWPRHCRTRDGAAYRIRPIRADDTERDRAFIKGLSESSRYNRLMGLSREPSSELLDHLVHVDYQRDMALVAVVGEGEFETIIGVARYCGDPDASEFAIAVADEWQSRGIGATLTRFLFSYAKAHGVRRLYGIVFANNARMLNLARYMQMTLRRSAKDDAVLEAWQTL